MYQKYTSAFINQMIKAVVVCFIFISSTSNGVDYKTLREQYSKPIKFWPAANIDDSVQAVEIGELKSVNFPIDNPFSGAKLKLGEKLFHDGRLSRSKQIACSSCHDTDLGWADGRKTSFGHDRQRGKRNAPTIENVAYNQHFFWDGRAKTLEKQALMPIQDPLEMNFTLKELEQRLSKIPQYREMFQQAFEDETISAKKIAQALATYQRTIVSRRSDFDRFLSASEQKNERAKKYYQAIWGMHLFRTKARCMNCHYGPTFTDQKFHNLGLTYYKRKYEDLGLYSHSKLAGDIGKFKTPGLRGVMNTGPWMHNGLFADITGVLNFYNAGGIKFNKLSDDPLSPVTSNLMTPLNLSREEVSALATFLQSITAPSAVGPAGEFIK